MDFDKNSPQSIFDKVVAHLAEQGRRSEALGDCRYRSKDGLMCAVGCLIPDEDYDPRMDCPPCMSQGTAVSDLLDRFPQCKWMEDEFCLLSALQNAHDGSFSPEELNSKLASIAKKHNLRYKAGTITNWTTSEQEDEE